MIAFVDPLSLLAYHSQQLAIIVLHIAEALHLCINPNW